ncbi:TetR/AcrR family transcriptional regulator [Corallococcus carmarthensis]|uniref:TetR/AcrR family transcriptional regulator n=1 Tax=Corallococcus carmarthensis TaxID=2316728 RepID=A0A3A8KJG3_9BACT|nr:TetR/AcrR family transcriptional regulator [Corallococcus carmarthensis]NOK15485.1 TetR/AcrR family transcriptional regulator [Corallococcus carmarthensis]RKH07696.1 TetR/AcrR family transcriptional regulator [Corallococcus carmarthensis]
MARPVSIRDEDILDAAREIFLAHGVRATSAMVAERARVSEGIIFRRFKTKEGLFRAALDVDLIPPPEVAELKARIGVGSVVENLQDAGVALVGTLRVMIPLSMLALSNPSAPAASGGSASTSHPRDPYFDFLVAYLQGEVDLGRLRAVDPEVFTYAFLGGLKDYVVGQIFRTPTTPFKHPTAPLFVRRLLELLMHGAQRPAEPATRR